MKKRGCTKKYDATPLLVISQNLYDYSEKR